MNNTAVIRALTAIIIIVVFIFTAESLGAAASSSSSSSSTPQPQNLICTQPGDNATCSQEGNIFTTTQIPLPTPQQPPAALAITRHVIDDIVATISEKDFSIDASGTNVWPQSSFQGAQSPGTDTAVTLKPGTFPVALLQQANATTTTTTKISFDRPSDIPAPSNVATPLVDFLYY